MRPGATSRSSKNSLIRKRHFHRPRRQPGALGVHAADRPRPVLSQRPQDTANNGSAAGGQKSVSGDDRVGAAAVPRAPGSVNEAIRSTAGTAGMDKSHWRAIAGIESGLNPSSNANKSTHKKPLPDRHEQCGLRGGAARTRSPFDPQANDEAAAKLASDNNAWFKGKYGRDPSPTETYMMHQQGRGFYSRGSMTNIAGNPYPGMRGPQTHKSFEAGWGREIERRASADRLQLDNSGRSHQGRGLGQDELAVNAPKCTRLGPRAGSVQGHRVNRRTKMAPRGMGLHRPRRACRFGSGGSSSTTHISRLDPASS